ncbi:MAG TPA: hypothetical protein VHG91_10850 [Longimicrobium sp.]|nr:hypothetical protein [Longimicrobium sp.]
MSLVAVFHLRRERDFGPRAGIPIVAMLWACATMLAVSVMLAAKSGWIRLARRCAGEPVRADGRVAFGSLRMNRSRAMDRVRYRAHVTVSDEGVGLSLPTLYTFGARPLLLPWASLRERSYRRGVQDRFSFLVWPEVVEVKLRGRAARLAGEAWERRGRYLGAIPLTGARIP